MLQLCPYSLAIQDNMLKRWHRKKCRRKSCQVSGLCVVNRTVGSMLTHAVHMSTLWQPEILAGALTAADLT